MMLNYNPKIWVNLSSRGSVFEGFLNMILILVQYFKIRLNPGYAEIHTAKKKATRICSHSILDSNVFCDINGYENTMPHEKIIQ